MNSIRLISGRVPVTDLGNLTADRYQFLGLNQAEPNLGNGYSSTDVLTLGTNGVRVWTNALSVVSVSASGNVTGNYIFGNGASLTGIVAVSNILVNGTSNVTIPSTNGNVYVGVNGANIAFFLSTGISLAGNVTANNGIFTTIVNTASHTGGVVSVTGNLTGNNAIITNIANAASFTGGLISITGNVQANSGLFTNVVNVASFTGGLVSVSGNATAGNVLTGGLASMGGNVTAGNINTGGLITATGNVTAGNINTGGVVSATGNVAAGNINTGGVVSATGNVSGGNLRTGGQISATGNVTTDGYFIGIFAGSITGNLTVPGSNTQVLFNNSGNAGASAGFTFDSATNAAVVTGTISSTGNVIAGNLTTGAQVSAAGNITTGPGSYFLGDGGLLSNITVAAGSQIVNGNSNVSIAANSNITVGVGGVAGVGVFTTTGLSLLGNITANNAILGNANATNYTGQTMSLSGNITGGNILA